MENKAQICDKLVDVLRLTRALHDLVDLDYIDEEELVIAHFENGRCTTINVACDSGIAMIRDVVNAIGG